MSSNNNPGFSIYFFIHIIFAKNNENYVFELDRRRRTIHELKPILQAHTALRLLVKYNANKMYSYLFCSRNFHIIQE